MEKDGKKTAFRPPPPPPSPPPRDYISGKGFGIRQLNAIRRNLVSPPGVPVGRFSTYEPIPLPIGLEHLNHVPPPKLVNGGKAYHRGCGIRQVEARLTRQPWKPHHDWVTEKHLKRERERRNRVEFPAGQLSDLPESMKECFNRFARKWQNEGLNVAEISSIRDAQSASDIEIEAPLPAFRKSYERYSNNLGWKTKAQVLGVKKIDSRNTNASGQVTQVTKRTPNAAKPNADQQLQQNQQPKQNSQQQQQQNQRKHQHQQPQNQSVLVKANDSAKYHASHKGQHVKYDEQNLKETFHPEDKDYGHMKIDEPPTPGPNVKSSSGGAAEKLDAEEIAKKIAAAKSNQSMSSVRSSRSSFMSDKAKEHYRGMGKVLMQSKSIQEQIAKDEEEERRKKKNEK